MGDAPRAASGAGEPEPAAEPSSGRNVPVAVVSGVALAIVFLGTLLVSPYAFTTFVAVVLVIGVLELDTAFRAKGLSPATPVSLLAVPLFCYGAYAGGATAQSAGLGLVALGVAVWWLFQRRPRPARDGAEGQQPAPAGESLGASVLVCVWVPFLASFIGLLLARDAGIWFVMATVALTVTADIGAFAWGYQFGRHKIASVSPGKTWEGVAGGLATTLVLAAAVTAWLPGFDLPTALVLAVGVTAAATAGDLTESLVKRDLEVKDLGRIIPGHGGIMDRIDGLLFAMPTAHLLLVAIGA